MPESNDPYAVSGAWNVQLTYDLKLPTGQLVLVKKLVMEDVVDLDLVEAMDTFTGLAEIAVSKPSKSKKKKTQEEMEAEFGKTLLSDKDRFRRVIAVADKVIVRAVVKPSVAVPPEDVTERVPGVVYLDTIPFGDKLFIFNSVFDGIGGLESFREEPTADVGNVANVEGVSPAPVADAGVGPQ